MKGRSSFASICRILALVVVFTRLLAFGIPRFMTELTLGVSLPIAGRTPEAAEFVRLSRSMHTASGLFRVIVRGIFSRLNPLPVVRPI